MGNTFILIKHDGTEIETPFIIINGKKHFSLHFSEEELNRDHLDKPKMAEATLLIMEAAREEVGPYTGLSGCRSLVSQSNLYNKDLADHGGKPSGKVANPKTAPHVYGFAADCSIPAGMNAERWQGILRRQSIELGFPPCRRGYVLYERDGENFVHMDTAPMHFAPYVPGRTNPDPVNWVSDATW